MSGLPKLNFPAIRLRARRRGDGVEVWDSLRGKAPCIPINSRTLAQAVRYNSVLGARYVILTNGLRHYCCECRDGEYVQLGGFPDLSGD